MRAAWRRRDAGFDGAFVFGVTTTGIYCRPSCPSRPHAANLRFFHAPQDAVAAGFRPCKRCDPDRGDGRPPDWVATLMARVEASPEKRFSARDLQDLGLAPERVRRWFQQHHGMTFASWCRGIRLSRALASLRSGGNLDDAALGHGYGSHSGFRTAFTQVFGQPPGQHNAIDPIRVALLDTPLGPMLAAADDRTVCHLEFVDRSGLTRSHDLLRRHFNRPVLPGDSAVIEQLRRELGEYFNGQRRGFDVVLQPRGTPFQERVWRALREIPYGATESYATVALRIGSPSAVRAVARANATNRLHILIPCHRVIGRDGRLSGYAGGVGRKHRLLELERRTD